MKLISVLTCGLVIALAVAIVIEANQYDRSRDYNAQLNNQNANYNGHNSNNNNDQNYNLNRNNNQQANLVRYDNNNLNGDNSNSYDNRATHNLGNINYRSNSNNNNQIDNQYVRNNRNVNPSNVEHSNSQSQSNYPNAVTERVVPAIYGGQNIYQYQGYARHQQVSLRPVKALVLSKPLPAGYSRPQHSRPLYGRHVPAQVNIRPRYAPVRRPNHYRAQRQQLIPNRTHGGIRYPVGRPHVRPVRANRQHTRYQHRPNHVTRPYSNRNRTQKRGVRPSKAISGGGY